jgi:uncharacterized protein (DUF1778 family)
MDDKALQSEGNWDYDRAERRPGRKPRAVVSVAFSREDFERVASAAEQSGMKVSEFIREAALSRSRGGLTEAHLIISTPDRQDMIFLGKPDPQTSAHSLTQPDGEVTSAA